MHVAPSDKYNAPLRPPNADTWIKVMAKGKRKLGQRVLGSKLQVALAFATLALDNGSGCPNVGIEAQPSTETTVVCADVADGPRHQVALLQGSITINFGKPIEIVNFNDAAGLLSSGPVTQFK